MDDSMQQEVDMIVDIMLKKTRNTFELDFSWQSIFKCIKILMCIFFILATFVLVANIVIGINSYIKLNGVDLSIASAIMAFIALNTESTSLEEKYYLMYHLKNDTRVPWIITTLQEAVVNKKMSIQSINIVEHKCQTYLQIRYRK